MRYDLVKKGMIFGIVVLFVGASVIPSMSENIEKTCCTNTVVNVKNRLSDQFDIPAENEVVMTEFVWIDDDGNCSLDLWLNISSRDLADNYSIALRYTEPEGIWMSMPENVTLNTYQDLIFDESISDNVTGDQGVFVEEVIEVNSSFRRGIHQQQLLSLGINISEFLVVEMCRVNPDLFVIHVHAIASFVTVEQSGFNWTVAIGPSNILASSDRANYILTQIWFIQQLLNSSGTQRYNSSWVTTFYLPPDAVLTNANELSVENWNMDFDNGTMMEANITPCTPGSPIVLMERMVVNNSNINMTNAQQLVESDFLCYKVFNIKYWKPTMGSPYCSSPYGGEDFRWSKDFTILKIKNMGFRVHFKDPFDGKVEVDVDVAFSLAFKAHMDLKTKWFKLRRFRAWMELNGYLDVNVNATATDVTLYDESWEQSLFEWHSDHRYVFFVGPVLVWVTPYFEAAAKLSVAVESDVWVTCGANATGSLRVGVGWKQHKGTYGILKAAMDINPNGPEWGTDMDITVTPSLGLRPKLLFYDIVGPSIEFEPYVMLTVRPLEEWTWKAEMGLNGNAGVGFSGVFKKLTGLDDLYFPIANWVFWEFPYPYHDISVTGITAPSNVIIGENMTVEVDVLNEGEYLENETYVDLFYKDNDIWVEFADTQYIPQLTPGKRQTVDFNCSTTDFAHEQRYLTLKATVYQQDDEIPENDEHIETNITRLEVQNVYINYVYAHPTTVNQGDTVDIDVVVENDGTVNVSNLPVYAYYNENPISDIWCRCTRWVFELPAQTLSDMLTFKWDTQVPPDTYIISAEADHLPYEDTSDNFAEDGYVTVHPGITYILIITATSGGTTFPSPGTYILLQGTIVNVTAIPYPNYEFDHWELDGDDYYDNPITVIMDSDHTLRAVFYLEYIEGDLDHDGDVDLSDLAQLLAHYGMTEGATYEMGDIDGDGDVDLSDLAALLANYGYGT